MHLRVSVAHVFCFFQINFSDIKKVMEDEHPSDEFVAFCVILLHYIVGVYYIFAVFVLFCTQKCVQIHLKKTSYLEKRRNVGNITVYKLQKMVPPQNRRSFFFN